MNRNYRIDDVFPFCLDYIQVAEKFVIITPASTPFYAFHYQDFRRSLRKSKFSAEFTIHSNWLRVRRILISINNESITFYSLNISPKTILENWKFMKGTHSSLSVFSFSKVFAAISVIVLFLRRKMLKRRSKIAGMRRVIRLWERSLKKSSRIYVVSISVEISRDWGAFRDKVRAHTCCQKSFIHFNQKTYKVL